jgi:hypothetical protein
MGCLFIDNIQLFFHYCKPERGYVYVAVLNDKIGCNGPLSLIGMKRVITGWVGSIFIRNGKEMNTGNSYEITSSSN